MGRRVLIGVASVLAWLSVASAQPTAGEAGSVEITSNGARYGQCEVLEFPAANYSPSRLGNVCSLPLGATVTQLGTVIGDDAAELQQGTALPATCDVGEMYFETDQPVPSTSADVCWMYVCTATNTWECLGDVNSGGRTGNQSITGGAAADGTLTLKSTANADMGSIVFTDVPSTDAQETLMSWAPTANSPSGLAVNNYAKFLSFGPVITSDDLFGLSPVGLSCTGSVSNATSITLPACQWTDWLLTATAGGLPAGRAFRDTTLYLQTSATTTGGPLYSVQIAPTFATDASGTIASTITTAYGVDVQPYLAAGTNDTQTVTTFAAFHVTDDDNASGGANISTGAQSVAGTETLTNYIGLDIASLSPANSGTAITLRAAGTDDEMRHAGPVMIGSGGVATSPGTTQLYVWQNTLGNEVARFQSTATNDDPEYVLTQSRVTTTDGTQTAFGNNVAVASGYLAMVEARIVARCTAGASCTSNQGASYVRRITCKNDAGTTAVVGAVQTIGTDQESTAGWDVTMDCDNTTDTARALVTGAATTTITWHVTFQSQDVST